MRCLRLALTLAVVVGGGLLLPMTAAAKKLRVLTSFLPVYCFTINVTGDRAEVENLLPAAVGPHDYQFAPRDRQKLGAADVIVVNGLHLESWLQKAIAASGSQRVPVIVEAAAGLKRELIYGTPGSGAYQNHRAERWRDQLGQGANPHIWLDPQLAAHAVTNILIALQKADPANGNSYARNAARYVSRLESLDAEMRHSVAAFKHRNLVTYHDALPYLARRYQLNLVGVVEEVPDVAPSAKYLASLLRVMREHDVKVIFTEPQFSPRLAQQIGRDLSVPVAELDTLESGPLNPNAYEEGMRRNLRTLEKYLR